MLILGYAIIQLPGCCRGCYFAIRKFLGQSKEAKKKKKNQIEIQEAHLKQTNTKIKQQMVETENRDSFV